jgi:NAD(P)-dependent dehydrogenase (short-subunit alcohol dehydrogenase family)
MLTHCDEEPVTLQKCGYQNLAVPALDNVRPNKRNRQMDFGLTDKRAFVGGGSRGIGKAIAIELAKEGCDVVIAARTESALEETAKEIQDITGRRIIPMVLDVTSREEVDNVMANAVSQLGGLDILVNSASLPGGSRSAVGPIHGLDENDLLRDFDTKYVGALRCARAAIPYLKEQPWSRIINISGGNARIAGNLSGGARNVSLVHLTRTLAMQMGEFGITVNCVHPGITRTERTEALMEARGKALGVSAEEAEARDFADGSPRGNHINRMIDASEIGFLTAYLASDKSWAVTGEVIMAGGGLGNSVYY